MSWQQAFASRSVIDTGPPATYAMTTYTASSYIWLGDYERARDHAERAIAAQEARFDGVDLGEALVQGGGHLAGSRAHFPVSVMAAWTAARGTGGWR
ncbi:hypothetical protein AB0F17_21565 [Nonomuraea sp. NPDC026600]|uniref:hypothetical protein n=1 Tax=Nonomuraea sp. NPDC026600 TaxID=3155363 RepID=UPI0033F8E49F